MASSPRYAPPASDSPGEPRTDHRRGPERFSLRPGGPRRRVAALVASEGGPITGLHQETIERLRRIATVVVGGLLAYILVVSVLNVAFR